MGEIPKLEDLVSPYAAEFRIGDKVCKIRKLSIRKRIEFLKSEQARDDAGDDSTAGLERHIDIVVDIVEGADREDLYDLNFEQLGWIISQSIGSDIKVPDGTTNKKGPKKN